MRQGRIHASFLSLWLGRQEKMFLPDSDRKKKTDDHWRKDGCSIFSLVVKGQDEEPKRYWLQKPGEWDG